MKRPLSTHFARNAYNGLQVGKRITVESNPGETWTLTSVEGLFSATSPAPPANPVPFVDNYELVSSGTGVYTLDAISTGRSRAAETS